MKQAQESGIPSLTVAELRLLKSLKKTKGYDYEDHKTNMRERAAALSASGREIGPPGPPANPERRAAAMASFRVFCETYHRGKFMLAWSPDHLRIIRAIEKAVDEGELRAIAMPRGSGKTTLCEAGTQWAVLTGRRRFVVVIAAESSSATSILENIKADFETNDLLAEDFHDVCNSIRALNGINQRAAGQTCNGLRTQITWTDQEIVLPTIDGSPASGAIIKVAGITGRIRGMSFVRPDGDKVRPDLVLIDDPQTDESARSPSQCMTRERLLSGAILGLAGPGKKIAGLMTATVIEPDDLADRILDRKKNPAWQGDRTKLMYAMPTAIDSLWVEYAKIRAESLAAEKGLAPATEFYLANRVAMDDGAIHSWPERYNKDEASAIQNAMNMYFTDETAFWAECQNQPKRRDTLASAGLTPDAITSRINRVARGIVPNEWTRLTAFVDVQSTILYWMVCGWRDDFSGSVIDYGTWPEQDKDYFTRAQLKQTLKKVTPGAGYEAALLVGLEDLGNMIIGREWRNEAGNMMRVEKAMIDANFGESTDAVRAYSRRSAYAGVISPSHGRPSGAKARSMSELPVKLGERIGTSWKTTTIKGQRHILIDTNYWKSFIAQRLQVSAGDPGSLTLPGMNGSEHRMLVDHICAEYPVRVSTAARTIDEWTLLPGRENDWLDCLVGCAVGASILGCKLFAGAERPAKKRVKYSELVAKRRAAME